MAPCCCVLYLYSEGGGGFMYRSKQGSAGKKIKNKIKKMGGGPH